MKNSLNNIYSRFPNVKIKKVNQDLQVTNTEDIFYQLSLFLEDPETYAFNINLIYKYLRNEDLLFALSIIVDFFQSETKLIDSSLNRFIHQNIFEKEKFYNQTMFANYLKENGHNFTPHKLRVYYVRGKLPKPDLVINGTPYWFEATVIKYNTNVK